jgi:hypothetical protein
MCISALIVVITFFWVRRHVYAAVLLPALFNVVDRPRAVRSRAQLYDAYCQHPDNFLAQVPAARQACEAVLYDFGRLGTLLHRGFLTEDVVIEWLHEVPIKLAVILDQYVADQARRRRDEGNFALPFKYLVKISLNSWRRGRLPDHGLVIFHSTQPQLDRTVQWDVLAALDNQLEEELRRKGWISPWKPRVRWGHPS